MAEPRFMIVRGNTEGGTSSPEWPTVEDPFAVLNRQDGVWSSWRLLSGNNRELGRGAAIYSTEQACLAGIHRAQKWAQACTFSVAVRPSGQWWWQLELEGDRIAVAGRAYQRQRECRYNLGQFLLALPVALPPLPSGRSLADPHASAVIELPAPTPPKTGLLVDATEEVRVRRTRSAPR